MAVIQRLRLRLGLALAAFFCALSVFACKQQSVSTAGTRMLSEQEIISQFEWTLPVAAPALGPNMPAAQNTSEAPLDHQDPLNLPGGNLFISGGDTLHSVTRRMAKEFNDDGYIGIFQITQSSTGAGVSTLCSGETVDLVNADRAMSLQEIALCNSNGVVPLQFQVGFDSLAILVNRHNSWLDGISRANLQLLYKSTNWSELDTAFPARPILFHAPNKRTVTMQVMSELVYGNTDAPFIRELNNGRYYAYDLELTRDLADTRDGIGFASFGKLHKLKQLPVKVIPVDDLLPILSGTRYPLNRALYIITTEAALNNPALQAYVAYYLNRMAELMPEYGFTPIGNVATKKEKEKFSMGLPATDSGNDPGNDPGTESDTHSK